MHSLVMPGSSAPVNSGDKMRVPVPPQMGSLQKPPPSTPPLSFEAVTQILDQIILNPDKYNKKELIEIGNTSDDVLKRLEKSYEKWESLRSVTLLI